MTSISKNKGVKFSIPSWVPRIESCRKSLTHEHSEKNTLSSFTLSDALFTKYIPYLHNKCYIPNMPK